MTQPLPNPTSKAAQAAPSRLDIGNFFQPAAGRGASPDFESLFADQNSKSQRDSTEESESSRRKKKSPAEETPSIALPSAPSSHQNLDSSPSLEKPDQNDPLLTPSPHDPSQQTPETAGHDNPENTPETAKAEKDSPTLSKEIAPEEENVESNQQQPDSNPVVDGMETAPNDAEMISLATFDAVETGTTPVAREPLLTSSNRLSVATAIADRAGVSALQGANSSSESSLGQTGTGTSPAHLQSSPAPAKSPAQAASSILKNLPAEIEKLRQSGQSQVQIELNIGEQETLKVRLQMRAGELRSTFITDSQELREALQKAWPDFAQDSRDRGFRFGNPAFQNAFSQNDSPSQGRQRSADRPNPLDLPPTSKSPARHSTAPATTHGRAALWA